MEPDNSESACRRSIEPFHDDLWKAVEWAVNEFNKIPDLQRLPLMVVKRALRTNIHAYWMVAVRRDIEPLPGIRAAWNHESVELFIGDNMVLRLKKVDNAGFSSNYPTDRATSYHDGNNYELFGDLWAVPNHLELGYQLNELGTGVEKLSVVRRLSRDQIDWQYDILPPAAPTALPLPVVEPLPGLGGRRVTLRDSERALESKENEADNK